MKSYLIILFAVGFMACKGDRVQSNCREYYPTKIDSAASFIVQCTKAATAQTTGENQDAEDWVHACTNSSFNLFGYDGFRIQEDGGMNDPSFYITPCLQFEKQENQTDKDKK